MIWFGVVLFAICVCVSCYSVWLMIQLRDFITASAGYYRGYEFSIKDYCQGTEESLIKTLIKAENWFKKDWVSVFQLLGWLFAIPLMAGGDELICALWIPSLLLGASGFSMIKKNTIDICYLVLRQEKERKILINPEISDSGKITELKFLREKH